MPRMRIKKGDLVQVITGVGKDGADRGKQGRVIEVYPDTQRVRVEGVNRVTKHTKSGSTARGSSTGGLVHTEAPVHVSNVQVVDPATKKPTRLGVRVEQVEKRGRTRAVRTRIARRSGKDIG